MFCSTCGAQIADGSVFCPNCGSQLSAAPAQQYAPANDPVQQYQAQRGFVRQNETNILDNITQYFSARQNQYAAYDEAAKKVNHFAGGAKKGLIVWGAIIFFISLFAIIAITAEYYYDEESVYAILGSMTIPSVLMITGGILMQVANHRRYNSAKEEYHALANDLFHFYSAYPNCPIGYTYCHPRILQKLQNILRTGRADTIKDGMNMLLHQASERSIENYLEDLQENAESGNVIVNPDLFR